MELMTVSQVSRSPGISTRMLRYYEQAGLVESLRQEGDAYRIYDKKAVLRLKQILMLRRLRIPVRQIKAILQKEDAVAAIEIFRENIRNLNEEMTALSVVKEILNHFVEELSRTAELPLEKILLKDDVLADSIESLGLISINFKEDQTMEKLKKAEAGLSRIGDVRIIYLPPSAVAAVHYVGDEPEIHVNEMLDRFVRETGLHRRKPDLRHYGFNHPNPTDATGFHGYESWVTIPEDMEVPAPLVKKLFVGGIYAAHMISFGSFNEWDLLLNWVNSNEKYEFAGDMADQEHMCGLLEEHLNYISHVELANTEPEEFQLDLLVPVRERKI